MLADGLTEERPAPGSGRSTGTACSPATCPASATRSARARGDPDEVAGWQRDPDLGGIGLAEVVARVHPTILIGTSTRSGAFTEEIVREMAAHVERPVILPMSNPTELAEAAPGRPDQVDRRPGSRRDRQPVRAGRVRGTTYVIGQANNALVFPGIGLGVIAVPGAAASPTACWRPPPTRSPA